MKRLLVVALSCMLLFGMVASHAMADDYSFLDKMTLEQLEALQREVENRIRIEMLKYHPLVEEGTLLYGDKSVSVTYAGSYEFDWSGDLLLDVIIINDTTKDICISADSATCNGWSVNISVHPTIISANSKAKGTVRIKSIRESTDVSLFTDIKDIEAKIHYFDTNTYKDLVKKQRVVWIFNQ